MRLRTPNEAVCRELLIAGVGSEPWPMGPLLERLEQAIEEGSGVRWRDVIGGC